MADEHTPTTDVVRDAVTFPRRRLGEPRDMTEAAFDRWLAAHDAEIRETATREERWRCIALIRQRFGTANRAADWLDRLDREGAK